MNRLEWYQRFVDDHCLGDENHPLIKVFFSYLISKRIYILIFKST